jgi:hypothetical protein
MKQPQRRQRPPAAAIATRGQRTLTPGVLLELYDEPVSFHRSFVELGGGVTAALFLSCACHEAALLPAESDGWLRLSTEQWRDATCLSRHEQDGARKALRDKGLIEERRIGMPARLEIRVDVAKLVELLQSQAARKYEGLEQIDYSKLD